jgi:hypothetical protein
MFKFFALFALLITPASSFAHGGGLNKEGCHNNRKTGDYHCHRKAVPKQQTLTGIPKITDGDTIRIIHKQSNGQDILAPPPLAA